MTRGQSGTAASTQNIQNESFDPEFGVLVTEGLGYDGVNLQKNLANSMAMKITEVGDVTYVAMAAPGTAQATAKWQAMKIDETTGIVITWADGDADFDNISTDLTALSYS